MLRKKIILFAVMLAFSFSLVNALPQEQENDKQTFSGSFMLGYRSVSTSGTYNKYREDINLDDGIRLFNFNLHFTPDEAWKKVFDRLDLNVYNYGGDPFETFGLSIQKYGTYQFQYDRKKSEYFYHDMQEIGGGHLYDMHSFNFDRVSDSGLLKIRLGSMTNLYLDFDRYTKKGNSITSLDINRIEFEFEKPINEESKAVTVGAQVNLKRYSFIVEEKFLEYKNSNSLFLPGFADGGAGASYPSSLNYFFINQPYELKSNTHSFKLNARPFDSLLIAGSAVISDQDMDLSYSEGADGVNYLNRFFTYGANGEGSFERKLQMFDLDLTYLLFNKLAVIGAVRSHDFEQTGSFTINAEEEEAMIKYDTLGIEAGLQYQFSSQLALTVGYRNESRELDGVETVTYEEKTQRNGIFGNMKWDPSRAFKLILDYQHGSYDDPYTTISPTSMDRFKATTKIQVKNCSFSGSYLFSKSKSEVYSDLWESTKNQFNLRAGYHASQFKLFAGYSLMDIKHEGDRTIAYPPGWSGPGGTFLWDILYEGKSRLMDASLAYNLDANWSVGGYANFYSNTGFWEISRKTFKAYLEYAFEMGLVGQLGYRYVKFEEKDSGFNDYSANILELSFGYRWK